MVQQLFSCTGLYPFPAQPEDQPNTLFKYLWEMRGMTGECQMCQFLARHRVNPQPEYNTCLFDRDWYASRGFTVGTWHVCSYGLLQL